MDPNRRGKVRASRRRDRYYSHQRRRGDFFGRGKIYVLLVCCRAGRSAGAQSENSQAMANYRHQHYPFLCFLTRYPPATLRKACSLAYLTLNFIGFDLFAPQCGKVLCVFVLLFPCSRVCGNPYVFLAIVAARVIPRDNISFNSFAHAPGYK